METIKILNRDIRYIKLPHDINGNPRYYIGLTSIMQYLPEFPNVDDYIRHINKKRSSLSLYRGKKYGYGYTIQSYNLESDLTRELENHILKK